MIYWIFQVGNSVKCEGADHAITSIHNVKEAIPEIWAEPHFFTELRLSSNAVALETMAWTMAFLNLLLSVFPSLLVLRWHLSQQYWLESFFSIKLISTCIKISEDVWRTHSLQLNHLPDSILGCKMRFCKLSPVQFWTWWLLITEFIHFWVN